MAVITLPERPLPQAWRPRLLDFGFIQKPATGAAALRIDRPGNRFAATFIFPPMAPAQAEVFVSRLLRAKRQGLRIALPLLVPQGAPGTVLVDGAGQSGTSLAVKGLTPGHVLHEGFWLNVWDGGVPFLHRVATSVAAGSDGKAALSIEPPLRIPPANNAAVELAHPVIEGFVEGEAYEWELPVNRLIQISFPIEEAG